MITSLEQFQIISSFSIKFFCFDFSITNLVLVNFLVLFFFSFIIFLISSDINQKEIPLLTKTPEKDSSPSKGSKKRKEGVGSKKDGKKISKKGKSESSGGKNPHSAGVDNHDNDGFRTPERQENTDLENAPNPPVAERQEWLPTEEVPQKTRDQFDNIFQGNKKI